MAQQQIIPMWHLGGEQKKCKQERQVHWNKDLFPFLFLVIVQISEPQHLLWYLITESEEWWNIIRENVET